MESASPIGSAGDDENTSTGTSQNRRQKKHRAASPTGAVSEVSSQIGPRPIRPKSAFEQMEADFSKTGTKTFLYRLIVIGTHDELPDEFLAMNESMVNRINARCYDEPISGLCVIYPAQFIHLLEGSEDTLNKYIVECAQEFDNKVVKDDGIDRAFAVKMRVLNYVRVSQRVLEKWNPCIRKDPGTRNLMRIHGFRNRLTECIKSIWVLAAVYTTLTQEADELFAKEDNFPDPEEAVLQTQAAFLLQDDLDQELNTYLPNAEIVNYLMKPKKRLPPVRTLTEYIKHAWNIPDIIFDTETAWPIPCRFAPYD